MTLGGSGGGWGRGGVRRGGCGERGPVAVTLVRVVLVVTGDCVAVGEWGWGWGWSWRGTSEGGREGGWEEGRV